MKDFDDRDIDERDIDLAKRGDGAAFRKVVERYQRDVLLTVVGIVGRSEDVDDIVQEVFIRFHRSLSRFEGRSSVKTYLTRIAVNGSLDYLRKQKRKNSRETSLDAASERQQFVETSVDSSDDQEIIRLAIESLPEKYRTIVTLRMIEGYSTQETAELLGVKYGTVLSRLSRALDKMRIVVEPHYPAYTK